MMENGQRIRILDGSEANLRLLAGALASGNLVAIPTETVYGLAANALDEAACRRIFSVKGRPLIDPLIVHVTGPAHAEKLAFLNDKAVLLMEKFWPGPLTIVLKKRPHVPDLLSAGLPTVALRCPRHPLTRRLLQISGLALAAPSANRFGYVSPTRVEHVVAGLGERIDYVLDGGPCDIGLESTILGLADPEKPVLFRPGAISREVLSVALGRPVALPMPRETDAAPADAPGMLKRHYSPNTRVTLFDHGANLAFPASVGKKAAIVYFTRPSYETDVAGPAVFWLSESGRGEEAARNVFDLLRRLDGMGYEGIFIEKAPEGGIGDAINDRLTRAAAR
jgi:L-threonylcarbamoyladenylate synthase